MRLFALRSTITLAFIATIVGCTPATVNSPNKYILDKVPANIVAKKTSSRILLIPDPESRPIYNTKEMAYTIKPYEISYYAKTEWAETPAQMLQTLLTQTLENTHYFRAIVTPPYGGPYDYSLRTEIVTWQQDFTCPIPVFIMSVRVYLIKNNTNQIVATRQLSSIQPMPQRSPYGGVFAGNRAVNAILEQIAVFSMEYAR